ncbi:Mg chelatase-like protein [Pseudoclavibacter sp. RFBJ3]|uniref:YifB family Mg chelatase-like AAA ATPase n=1 Tax=unclassified Pseudoclavibacter TaxID=2615177 RepID=UPI000CE88486|nr:MULTISPECIES: YifB family Mg chelatase-like AAA ATPase [unclassified Pseudoclavibacter]PPF76851.1 Mg chelatase-like protein [Pseudoclavibacter sp. Z016]PPF85491.1 Mg chelatase-like protein [Pseudoclavibacter sp. RFBJ5]PPF93114.1 Mg chelatase-like protein [Pseudoclavibacter sp. RFBJ3]PPF99134.1 Mg chelatase-like protein [Pseudoclavibacter sp. RFBH5]PPG25413.1 Mg chelatase-like protein [Pseudoclavibacter sp. RFBI4]
MTQGTVGHSVAIALEGLGGELVEVETQISPGLPFFKLVGLPDTSLGEARERVRAALQSSGCPLPASRVVTNMYPASLRKHGAGFDLAIAVSFLAAAGIISAESPTRAVHIGELSLTGQVRAVVGVLPAVAAARAAGFDTVVVPADSKAEAELVEDIRVVAVTSLRAVALHYGADADELTEELEYPSSSAGRSVAVRERERSEDPTGALSAGSALDLSDVVGSDAAVRTLIIAAAGGHHLLMLGPPGAGKTMLAERLPGILPDLEPEAAVTLAAVRSLRGMPLAARLDRRPPFEAPHHTASAVALLGGGSGLIRPGAISLATGGVLFLDEAPEFARHTLDSMRQPLENGVIEIHRAQGRAAYPAEMQLVLAANPCPCGNHGDPDAECRCDASAPRRYLARLSGPLLDRIDLQLRVERVSAARARLVDHEAQLGHAGQEAAHPSISTATARGLVEEARGRARRRLESTPWTINARIVSRWLRAPEHRPRRDAYAPLAIALERGQVTMRGHDRVLRVAWTIADLDGASRPEVHHVHEALSYRIRLG